MKRMFAIITVIAILISILPVFHIYAADLSISLSDKGYITEEEPNSSSVTAPFVLNSAVGSETALFYKFDISSLTVPSGKYIGEVLLKLTLVKNNDYTNGELIIYNVSDNSWRGSSLSFNNAPSYSEPVGRLSGINLKSNYNVLKRIDITSFVSEAYYSGENYVSLAITNANDISCSVAASAPALEINYTDTMSPVTVSKPAFYINSVSESNYSYNGDMGENMVLVLPAEGASAAGEEFSVLIASYTDSGIASEVTKYEKTIYSSTSASIITFPFKHSQISGYVKAFVWKENMQPLTAVSWYTAESHAYLNSVSVSSGVLSPAFSPEIHDYYIAFEEEPHALPEITYTYPEGATVVKTDSTDFNVPTTFAVTSADGNLTVTYTFSFKLIKKAVISADKLGIKSSSAPPDVYPLPYRNENGNILNNADSIFLLSFDGSVLEDADLQISEISLELFAKGNNTELQAYRNTQKSWSNLTCPVNEMPLGAEGILNGELVISGEEYKHYKIGLNTIGLSNLSSVNLALKGSFDIWMGENGIETNGALRAPVISISYVEKNPSAAPVITWDEREVRNIGIEWSFTPSDKYITEQNPPAFRVPHIEEALSYDFIVCEDEALNSIKYSANNVESSIFNFPCEFEPGTYYWSARHNDAAGYSDWSEPRRFTVREDAYSFPVPDIGIITEQITAHSHPRLIVTEETLSEFRALKDVSPGYYESIISAANSIVNSPNTTEPVYTGSNVSAVRSSAEKIVDQIVTTGLAYLITGEARYANTGKSILLAVADWELDPDGATSYKVQDQMYRVIVYDCALGYDWFYNNMTDAERAKVRNMLAARAIYEEHPSQGLNDSPYQLVSTPYVSHGWGHTNAILSASLAIAGENQTTDGFLKTYLPYMIGCFQWLDEDGAYANGFAYSTYFADHRVVDHTLKNFGIDVDKTANRQNLWKYYFYTAFNKTSMEFGDESYGAGAGESVKFLMKRYAQFSNSPYAKWKYESIDVPASTAYAGYYDAIGSDIEPKAPYDLPKSHLFNDAGYVAMHSDLIDDENRISLYFRSSRFGSRSHNHADNNSFHIQAYGQRLAIDSGYDDGYMSTFDAGYTRNTHAHNAITINGGTANGLRSVAASGKITNFITNDSFDLTSGDATNVYNYYENTSGYSVFDKKVDRALRHIIYIRPDIFVIIDDLKAKDNDEITFEWWLHAQYNIDFKQNSNGAVIWQNGAQLDADIVYPSNILKGNKLTNFSGIDGVEYTPSGNFAYMPVHKRIWFETPAINETKIITVINVHKTAENSKKYDYEDCGDYVKISFENSNTVYIKKNSGGTMSAGGYFLDGAALVTKGDSFMLVDGTFLRKDEETLIISDAIISASLDNNHLSLSGLSDSNVQIKTDDIYGIYDENGMEKGDTKHTSGVGVSYENGILNVDMFSGFYSLYLNTANDLRIPVTMY